MNSSNGQKLFKIAVPQIAKFTCQLYHFKKGFPIHFGCAVLLRNNNNYYCLSNAHVLIDGDYTNLFFLSEKGLFLTLAGNFVSTSLPVTGDRRDDGLDLVVVHLTQNTVDALMNGGYSFLPIDNTHENYTPSDRDVALVVGYPSSLTKLDFKNRNILKTPLIYASKFVTKNTNKIHPYYQYHFYIKYTRRSLYSFRLKGRRIGPMPHGISGSGLWQIGLLDGKIIPLLIGIASEYLENKSIFIYIRIDYFMEVIRNI